MKREIIIKTVDGKTLEGVFHRYTDNIVYTPSGTYMLLDRLRRQTCGKVYRYPGWYPFSMKNDYISDTPLVYPYEGMERKRHKIVLGTYHKNK